MDDRLAGRDASAGPRLPPLRPLPAGRRRLAGPVVGQLVGVELVAFAVAAVLGRGTWLLAAVTTPGVLIVLLLLTRRRGRWWYQQVPLRWRFRCWNNRRDAVRSTTAAPASTVVDARYAGLREVMPELSIMDVTERGGTFGMGYDGTGWFAALWVEPSEQDLPLPALADVLSGAALSRLQVLQHTAPAPVTRLNAWSPAAASYQDIAARLTGSVPPGINHTYLVVRLDAEDAVEVADSRGGGVTGVRRALAAALQRVGRTLSTVDVEYRQLRADALVAALAGTLGLGSVPTGPKRTEAHWDRFVADGYAQVCFQVTSWPPAGGRLAAALEPAPAAWTTMSLLLGPDTDRVGAQEVALRGQLRLAAAPDAIDAACAELVTAAGLQGLTLSRLDGEHGAASYATAPTGGTEGVGAAGHACPVPALDLLAAPVGSGGVLLGRDPDQKPVLVQLFRPRPVRMVLVGGIWPTRPVLLRCLAVGARVVAAAGRPDWVSLGRWATGTDHWVLPPGTPVPPAHPAAPILVGLDTIGMDAAGTAPPPVGWQSVAVTCTRPSSRLLAGADLVITGRLLPPDAALVADTFGLTGDAPQLLSRLYDDMVAVVEPGTVRFAWPTPGAVEREVLTPPPDARPALGAPPR